ncbi:MAG: hypothetical protein H8E84_04965 [Flavobacteriales bacterium]|nr:hypothetical protein [Flavobacteriales bacterium]
MEYLAVGLFLNLLTEPFVIGDKYWGVRERFFLFIAYPLVILGVLFAFGNGWVKFDDEE